MDKNVKREQSGISLRSRKSRQAAARRRARTELQRRRRPRRDPNPVLRRFALCLFLVEMGVLLLANPFLRVTKVHVEGTQTLTPQQVFDAAQVPAHQNAFVLALREHFGRRIASSSPVVDHASQQIILPSTLVLRVAERQPFAVLQMPNAFYLMDKKGVPYRVVDAAPDGLPVLAWDTDTAPALGRRMTQTWLLPAFALLASLPNTLSSAPQKIDVDQNGNMCLNRDGVRVVLGQPDALPQKVALAQAALSAQGGIIARRALYLDVSCPEQPVWMPRSPSAHNVDVP